MPQGHCYKTAEPHLSGQEDDLLTVTEPTNPAAAIHLPFLVPFL